jgi:hypothetical protein
MRLMMKTLALALVFLCPVLVHAAGKVPPCDPSGPDFCDLPRPEDIAFVPGSDWMAVSTASHEAPLMFINATTRQRVPLALPFAPSTDKPQGKYGDVSAPDCPGPPGSFRAGGNDIKRVGSQIRMLVINHPEAGATVSPADEGGRVEMFSIELIKGVPQAHWLGCFPVPQPYNLNDVAIGPRGEVYASHQHDRTHSPAEYAALREKWLAHVPTGYSIEWKHGEGWTRVPGTDMAFANGAGASFDDRVFAQAGTYSEAVAFVDRRTGVARRVSIPVTPDNITPLKDGGFIAVGHTGAPVTGIDPCRPVDAVPCGFPFAVVRIDRDDHVTVIFEHDGKRIPGASVAVLHGGKLYFGSAFGDRVAVVDRPANAPVE